MLLIVPKQTTFLLTALCFDKYLKIYSHTKNQYHTIVYFFNVIIITLRDMSFDFNTGQGIETN